MPIVEPHRDLYVTLRPEAHRKERFAIAAAVLVSTIMGLAAIPCAFVWGVSGLDAGLFVLFYLASGLGITVGYHRLFAHRSFQVGPSWRALLAVLGYTAGQGPVVYWVAHHRLHHARTDTDSDPHSPIDETGGISARSFLHAHVGWMLMNRKANAGALAPDLLRDAALVRLEKHYLRIHVASILLPGVIAALLTGSPAAAASAVMYAGFFRQFAVLQVVYAINSVCHAFGRRSHETDDASRNVWWLSVPSLGESWHNSHHANAGAANFGRRWYEIDIGYAAIRLLAAVGVATQVVRVK